MHFIFRDDDDSPITEVWVSEDHKDIRFVNYKYFDEPLLLPFGSKNEIQWADVQRLFRRRSFDPDRPDTPVILRQIGIEKYDPEKICRYFKGHFADDGCWIDFLEV